MTRMRDIPMSDHDRELFRAEFDNFDDMTIEQFREAMGFLSDSILDAYNELKEGNDEHS